MKVTTSESTFKMIYNSEKFIPEHHTFKLNNDLCEIEKRLNEWVNLSYVTIKYIGYSRNYISGTITKCVYLRKYEDAFGSYFYVKFDNNVFID